MPDDATSSPLTSTGYPDVGTEIPQEMAQANKRAASIGLLSAGLAILAGHRQRGESTLQPIARGAMVGLDQYSDSMKTAAQQLFERQRAILEQRKTDIAEQRAETSETRAEQLGQHQLEQDKLTEEARTEQRARDVKNESLLADLRTTQQQQADTQQQRADTQDALEKQHAKEWSYVNDPEGTDRFAPWRDSSNPKIRDYLTTIPPESAMHQSRKENDAAFSKFQGLFAKEEGFGVKAGAGGKTKYEVELSWPPGSKPRPYDVMVGPDGKAQTIMRKSGIDYPNVDAKFYGGGYKDVPPLSIFGGKTFAAKGAGGGTPTWDTHRVDLTAHPVGSTIDLGNGKTGIVTADGRIAKPNGGAAGRSGEAAPRAPSTPDRGKIAGAPSLYKMNGIPFKAGNFYVYKDASGKFFIGEGMGGTNLRPATAEEAAQIQGLKA